jgi:glycosyltransferase involved in cell wall biosynthesis
VPFLDKGVPADAQRLHQLLQRAHFLLLPTRAECMGLVFCEASAHGVPAITTQTGGVPAVVEEGVNGRTLPLSATGEDFGRVVAQEWRDREAFVRFSQRARQRYEERLNWEAWGRSLRTALQQHFPALARREAAPAARASA